MLNKDRKLRPRLLLLEVANRFMFILLKILPGSIVFGGWQKPQGKMAVENRVLEIVNACGFTANHIYARRRGQVGFANFKNMDDVLVHVRDQEAAVYDEDDGRRRDHVDQVVGAEERARAHQALEVPCPCHVRMVGLSGDP